MLWQLFYRRPNSHPGIGQLQVRRVGIIIVAGDSKCRAFPASRSGLIALQKWYQLTARSLDSFSRDSKQLTPVGAHFNSPKLAVPTSAS